MVVRGTLRRSAICGDSALAGVVDLLSEGDLLGVEPGQRVE